MLEMASHEELLAAQADLGAELAELGCEKLPLTSAFGRVAAKAVRAEFALPSGSNAAVDGYAFDGETAAGAGGILPIVQRLAAGDLPEGEVRAGAYRIFTGALLPEAADRTAMQEDCEVLPGGRVRVPLDLARQANCRLAGEDVKVGETILLPGQVLRAAEIAGLAALGMTTAEVRPKLKVALLSSGREIIPPGAERHPGQVFDANGAAMAAALQQFPAELVLQAHVDDAHEQTESRLSEAAAAADLVITTGGASLGEEDHFYHVLQTLGEVIVRRIKVKPGRPLTLGRIGKTAVLHLPGNPVAALVCLGIYGRDLILAMQGVEARAPLGFRVPANFSRKKKPSRHEFWRGEVKEDGSLSVFPRDGSGLISALRATRGLIEVPAEVTQVKPGDPLRFISYRELGLA